MIDERFVYAAFALNIFGASAYIWSTLKGETKPNRVSWFVWGIAPIIAFAAQFGQGVGLRSYMTLLNGLSPMAVFLASFINKNAYWKISRLDIICGGLSILGLILWLITKTGNIAILFSIMADGLAALPTVIKSYQDPESENPDAFFYAGIGSLIVLFTIKDWTFAQFGFPLYIFLICALLFVLIKFKIGNKKAAK